MAASIVFDAHDVARRRIAGVRRVMPSLDAGSGAWHGAQPARCRRRSRRRSSLRGLSSVTMMLSASSAAMRAHQRTLAGIAIAAAAEHAVQLAAAVHARGTQRFAQRVGRVRVVDDGERLRAVAAEQLRCARSAGGSATSAFAASSSGTPQASSVASTVEQVLDVEIADAAGRATSPTPQLDSMSITSPRRFARTCVARTNSAIVAARRRGRDDQRAHRDGARASSRAERVVDVDDARARAPATRTARLRGAVLLASCRDSRDDRASGW